MSVELRNRITRICKEKGMSLNTIADRIGNNASNLSQSLKGNPTVSTLQAIADCLAVNISDFFEARRTSVSGILEVDGQLRRINSREELLPIAGTFGIPTYVSYRTCKKDLKAFIRKTLEKCDESTFSAVLDGKLLINVFKYYDDHNIDGGIVHEDNYALTVHKEGDEPFKWLYYGSSYSGAGDNADLDNILQAMWVDIVGYMDKDRCFDEPEEIEHFALED